MQVFVVALALFAVASASFVPQLGGRIVGGVAIDISETPYQVSVRVYDQHICGGSILDANTILTAAHCTYGQDHSRYSVRVGATKHREGQSITVSKVIQNANYDPKTTDNDMAILKLSRPLSWSSTVQPVPLQPRGQEVAAGTTSLVSGWGVTAQGSQTVPESLRAVAVNVITNAQCRNAYGSAITSHMLCAYTVGKDSCQGDSGGPLVAGGRLIGVVSWGAGCAAQGYPGVYAKVSDMYNWIIANK